MKSGSTPSRAMISRLRREMQAARLPTHTVSSASRITQRTPWFASPSASAMPTGPPPAITTGWRPGSTPSCSSGGVHGL